MAPVLCAVISSLTVSAPISSPISSRPEPVVPTPQDFEAVAELGFESRQAALHDLNGPALGAQIDLVQQIAGGVDDDQVGGDGTDVDAEIRGDAAAVERGARRLARGHAAERLAPC